MDTEKIRAALQAALDALPPAPEPKKAPPAWLGSLSVIDHSEMCGKLDVVPRASLAARFCLHAMKADNPDAARNFLNDAADCIRAALAELEGC